MHCAFRQAIAYAYPGVSLRTRGKRLICAKVRASAAAEQVSLGSEVEDQGERIEGIASCKSCGGLGKLPRGGFHKKNPLNPAKLLRKDPSEYNIAALSFLWTQFRPCPRYDMTKGRCHTACKLLGPSPVDCHFICSLLKEQQLNHVTSKLEL